ncbi:Aspartate/glutamate/uridylate kinase [Thelephora terrestris]|uniref:aspartate kinase n=1 Tax=Thelephora terrestris TaxID=56493 RepID=A0A9P6HJ40_9AGAM|nr:Aspartate/glutamate/uridylate kinase [Thelephora terrestris]
MRSDSDSPDPLSSPDSPPPKTPPNLHQNTIDPDARWLVQKFGGTSVGKFSVKIARDIVSNYIDNHKVAVVCSARSGSSKALGTTNLLLKASSQALRVPATSTYPTPGCTTPGTTRTSRNNDWTSPLHSPGGSSGSRSPSRSALPNGGLSSTLMMSSIMTMSSIPPPCEKDEPPFFATVELIRSEHITEARSSITSFTILKELEEEIEQDCDALRSFLMAIQVICEMSPRSKDTVIGFGERMACKLMTAVLRDQGVDAEYVSLDSVVPDIDEDSDSHGPTLDQQFYDKLAVAFAERVKQCGSRVPVVTGFFGPVPGSLLRQIGRGYTDLCAAVLAVGLEASELQIWKEVDGIFTADPRKVLTARVIPVISPEEAAELTYYGSEVVHPFTMEQVIRRKIPIRIKNVENPSGLGTVIHPNSDLDPSETREILLPEPVSLEKLDYLQMVDQGHKKLPTAVTIKERIVVLNVHSNRKSVSHGFLAGIFGTLDRYGVVVDLISTSEVHISMAIEDNHEKKIMDRLVKDVEKYGTVTVLRGMAILSLVGKLKNMVGIAGRMFTSLANGNVNIEMISQGASEVNISCVIQGRDAVKALNLIHQSCLQIEVEGRRGRVGPWLF